MALPVCQFVDRVGSGAIQRLNLNDGERLSLLQGPDQRPGPDFSPPALKRAVVNTLLAEGASIPASAYDNRIIRLPLRVKACDEEEMAETLETLHRELDRANNILKWHPTYNSRPVYFRTFRSPDYRLDQTMEGRGELRATLAILAEPFAYGDYVEQTGTIYNDPAAVANGILFEIAAVEGDVPTPLYLYIDDIIDQKIVLAVRRHGTPVLYWVQAEATAPFGLDTTIQPNDPLMSGPGQNFARTTFAGAPGWASRIIWDPCPAAGSDTDYRGLYRVFVRVRRSGTTDDINVRVANHSVVLLYNEIVAVPKTTDIQLLDLGLVHFPPAPDPIYDGYSGIVLPVGATSIELHAERTIGTETLDWDYVVLVPADEELAIAEFQVAAGGTPIFDGPNDVALHGSLTVVSGFGFAPLIGSIPLVSPDQTNLYAVLRGIELNTLAWTMDYTARYWPRYLYIR